MHGPYSDKLTKEVTAASDIADERMRTLYERWESGGEMPSVLDFDPLEFFELAPYWSWIDVIDDGEEFVIRFMGSEIVNFMGKEATGMSLTEYSNVAGQRGAGRLRELSRRAYSSRRPVLLGPRKSSVEGRGWMTVTILALPLSTDGTRIDRILFANLFDRD